MTECYCDWADVEAGWIMVRPDFECPDEDHAVSAYCYYNPGAGDDEIARFIEDRRQML